MHTYLCPSSLPVCVCNCVFVHGCTLEKKITTLYTLDVIFFVADPGMIMLYFKRHIDDIFCGLNVVPYGN